MPVKVMTPTALHHFADGRDTIELEAENIGRVLEALADSSPQLRPHLFTDDGTVRDFVNLFVNDENIRDMQHQDTPVKDGDEIVIVPAIAGGKDDLVMDLA